MANFDTNTLTNFESVTKYNATQLIYDYSQWISNEKPSLSQFYGGQIDKVSIDIINELNRISSEINIVLSVIQSNNSVFTTCDYWELIEYIEDMRTSIDSCKNMSRWLQSTITSQFIDNRTSLSLITKSQQTLENFAGELGYSDQNDDFVQIALNNDLKEEDYSLDDNTPLNISFQKGKNIIVKCVIDNMIDDLVFGKDIAQKFTYSNNDLKVLLPKDTFIQDVTILAGLKQRDNPEFPEEGVMKDIVGSNIASVSFPVLMRQLQSTFSTDDTIKSFNILDIKRDQDNVSITMNIEPIVNEPITLTI